MAYTDSMTDRMLENVELPEADLYLFGRGEARRAYLKFGCHEVEAKEGEGRTFRFAVWAPEGQIFPNYRVIDDELAACYRRFRLCSMSSRRSEKAR